MSLWTPANTSTALWLDGSDAGTITTVNGHVSQWNDKSGNARNATQGIAGNRPAYTSSGLNGLSILTFDGGDNLVGNAQIASPGFGMFIVCSFADNSSRMGVFDIGNASGFNHCTIEQNTNVSPIQSYGFYATNTSCYSSLVTTAGHKVISVTSSAVSGSSVASTTTYSINGTNYALTITSGGNYGTVGNGYTVGAFHTGILPFTGTVAEIISFSSFVNTETSQKIEGYLAYKWGLANSLPSNHPYKSSPPQTGNTFQLGMPI